MTEQQYIITQGIPGSGKSTWAQQWVNEDPFNRVRINRDDLRAAVIKDDPRRWRSEDGFYVNGKNKQDFEQKVTQLEHSLTQRALKAGKSVVNDNTNLTPRFIKQISKFAQELNVPIVAKTFPITIEEAKRRNANRDRKVPEHVIENMFKRGLGPNGEFHHIDGTFPIQQFKAPEKIGRHAIGFDLDGTLADTRTITHFVNKDEKGRRNFDMFHRSSLFVPPNEDVVKILKNAQAEGYAVLITTARGEDYKEVSQKWLHENGIEFDNYYCRKRGDSRPDYVVKDEMFHEISKDYDLLHMVDDNIQAIRAWEEHGVLVTKVPFGDAAPAEGTIKITNPFTSGGCLRCGKPISKGTVGPRCAKKR